MAAIYFEPFDPASEADRSVTDSSDRFMNEFFAAGLREGVVAPPIGDGEVIPGLRGSCDVVGINYYMRALCRGDGPEVVLSIGKAGGLRATVMYALIVLVTVAVVLPVDPGAAFTPV